MMKEQYPMRTADLIKALGSIFSSSRVELVREIELPPFPCT
jgi:hypothetical protein